MSYRSPSWVRAEHKARGEATSELFHTEAQWQREAAWLSTQREVPVESALSRVKTGSWSLGGTRVLEWASWHLRALEQGLGQNVEEAGRVIPSAACLLTACQDPATGHLFC